MRRLAVSLLFLFFVLRMIVPALPVFVCHEMGGVHVLGPCCSSDESGPQKAPLLSARCCEQESQLKVDLQRPPQIDHMPILQAPLLVASGSVLEPLTSSTSSHSRATRADHLPIGPPTPLRKILRI